MNTKLHTALDGLLTQTASRHGGVPGVVAMATDAQANFYEGAAGVRQLGAEAPMTTALMDWSVMARASDRSCPR